MVRCITELVEEKTLQGILNSFVQVAGLRPIVVDLEGKPQMVPSKFPGEPKFCRLIKASPSGEKKCQGSYARAGVQAAKFGVPYIFRCHAGLIGWAAPLVFKKRHLGTIICGQVLMWKPEDFFWIELAEMTRDLDVKYSSLVEAAGELPIISGDRVQAAADLLFATGNYIVRAGITTLEQRRKIMRQQARLGEEIQSRKRLEKMLRQFDSSSSLVHFLKRERELLLKVKLGDLTGAERILNDILAELMAKYSGKIDTIKVRLLELLVLLSRAAAEAGANLDKLLNLNCQYMKEIQKLESMEDLCFFMSKSLERFIKGPAQDDELRNPRVIRQVTRFMRENYQKALTLEDVAKAVYLSPYYLSHIFKEELGCTVMEYLTFIRIEEAKKLLRDKGFSVTQVVRHIGYSDPSYFSKVFKKHEGITPTAFKEKFSQA